MSRESESERQLRNQVSELRDELRRLQIRVDRQEDQLSELSREVEESRSVNSSAIDEPSSVASIPSGSYSVVTPATGPLASGPPAGGDFTSWVHREAVAREIGEFLRRCLSGGYRGKSGREKLSIYQSRVYLVIRDIDGVVTENPVRVFTRFSEVKACCFRAGSCGDSIFVGLPSQREARVATESAAD